MRLFLSVDLVGSTAFKARFSDRDGSSSNPVWVTQIRHFYREFPRYLSNRFEKLIAATDGAVSYRELVPRTWKTIGDEIIFCVRLISLEHLAHCMTAFLRALEDYGVHLDGSGKRLDVKGAGWVAAFPAPNVTVEVLGLSSASDQQSDLLDEAFELRADKNPEEFDFLGKEIDSGFRAAKNAASDQFMASLELAWLLAEAAHLEIFQAKFSYEGRQILKGVISDRPYPLVSIDAERSMKRKEVRTREKAVLKHSETEPLHLRDFLRSFMEDEEIDLPLLNREVALNAVHSMPQCYKDFQEAWEAEARESEKRAEGELASESADGVNADLPAVISEALDKTLADSEMKSERPAE